MRKKHKITQIMAVLALFWIIIWIVWTAILFIFSKQQTTVEQTLSPEQMAELQDYINSLSGSTDENGAIETMTWEVQ